MTSPATTLRDRSTGRVRILHAVDAVAIVGLGLIALSPLDVVYDSASWWTAAAAGLVAGVLLAGSSAVWRWSAWPTALIGFSVYLVIATPLAQSDRAVAGLVPTPDSLRALVVGVVDVWRDMVTASSPLSAESFVLVPLITGFVGATVAGVILWRSPWPASAFVPVASMFVVGCAFGARETPGTVVRGLLLIVIATLWLRWRDRPQGRVNWGRRALSAGIVLAIALGATWGYAAATAEGDRRVLRDHVEPLFDPTEYASPLSAFRAYRVDDADVVQLRVDGLDGGRAASGRDLDPRISIATMDYFDGTVWNVAGGAGSVSDSGRFELYQHGGGGGTDLEITLEEFSSVWVPAVGDDIDIALDPDWDATQLVVNAATGTVAYRGIVESGDRYTVRTSLDEYTDPATIARAEAGSAVVPTPARELDALTEFATGAIAEAGAVTAGEQAIALETAFQQGFYSDGTGSSTSASGHGLRRLLDLMEGEVMVGNEEQYASAMALAAQQRGLPARVVLGFAPRGGAAGFADGEVRGEEISAWVEIDLDGLGWVPFDPTPDENRTQEERNLEPEPQPQPHVLQPPNIPSEPDDVSDEFPDGVGGPPDVGDSTLWALLRWIVVPLLGVLALLAVPAAIVGAKVLRRRRRRRAVSAVGRVSGAWRETMDVARDFGTRAPAGRSRAQSAVVVAERFPDSGVPALATAADLHIFGPDDPSDDESRAYWDQTDRTVELIRSSQSRPRRLLAALSLASLRPRRP